jgi:integrase
MAGAVVRLPADAGVASVADLAPDRIQAALGRLRAAKSPRTANHALGAVKGFARWLEHNNRIREVPRGLMALKPYSKEVDRKRVRRALSRDELARLVAAAEAGPDRHVYGPAKSKHTRITITGPARAALYRLAMGTGFRANELRSLTPGSFHLDGDDPAVTVAAAYSKRGRDDTQPIRRDLAEALRPFVAAAAPGSPVFVVPDRTADMLRADLEAAGIPYRDAAGRVADFHALRHSYITHLIESGATVKQAQDLARHSTPTLTIGRYAHTEKADLRRLIEGGE